MAHGAWRIMNEPIFAIRLFVIRKSLLRQSYRQFFVDVNAQVAIYDYASRD
jgi:hypothetical protein